MSGTKLGAAPKGNEPDARRSAILSSVFRSGMSMRSFAQLPAMTGTQPHPQRLDLSAEEKSKVMSRDLKVINPQAPKSLVRLKFTTNQFEEVVGLEESVIVNKETLGRIGYAVHEPVEVEEPNPEEEQAEETTEKVVLRNQFNFCDRATQGRILIFIDQGTLTEAPKPKESTGVTNQREIAAAYSRDKQTTLFPPLNSASIVTRVMERVVNQNLDPNAVCDFRYFDDPRDAMNRDVGYTLPLWEFRTELTNCQVTSIRWNPHIYDIFAVSYSPVAVDKTQKGYLATWSLKNQSTPRTLIELPSPALSVGWNQNLPSIIAVGTGDGNIYLYDSKITKPTPLFSTSKLPDRHASGVTVLRWQPPDASGNQNLLSAGLDGRILQWTLIQNEMKATEISQLPSGIVNLDYFNDSATHFRVGCDDGKIYNVLRTRTTQPPTSFAAHSPPVLAITFNPFHQSVYASSGGDWAVRIWREGETTQLQSFDYAPCCATDLQFAPHSSTILGAVTSDGVLYVYDLAVNRYTEISRTDVVETGDGGLTALRFHPKWPVLLVGDEKGRIHALKISPNLRRNTKTIKEEEERNKLNKSSSGKDSRGLLPDLANQPDEEDDAANLAAEEEARLEELAGNEAAKFVKSMGVSWIVYPEVQPALPAS
jgi:dynein intermediate chain 1